MIESAIRKQRKGFLWLEAAIGLVALGGGLLLSGQAMAQQSGIVTTKHNLTSTGPGNTFSGTDEICVYCHTRTGRTRPLPHRCGIEGSAARRTRRTIALELPR